MRGVACTESKVERSARSVRTSTHHLSPDLIQSSHENHVTLIHRINSHPATAVSSTNTLKSVGPPTLQPSCLLMSSGTPMLKILLLTYIWQFAPSVWRCENHKFSPLLFNHPPVLKHEVLSALFTLGHSVRLCDPFWREWDSARKPNGRF